MLNKKILVTGAAGFIGSHLAQSLLLRGDVVIGLDNLNPYYDPARKRRNLDELRAVLTESTPDANERFHFVEGDIRDRDLLDHLLAEYSFDAIAHLAAMAGVRASMENPYLYYDVNLIGTLNLLEAVRHASTQNENAQNESTPHFVFASTSSAYGATAQIPFVETDACDRPLAPYAASKRSGEMLGFSYHHLHGQSFTALRFFTVYGPRERPDMMAGKLAHNILHDKSTPLFNNGQMHRDWTYVSDIVSGIVAALDRPTGYEIINLGRGEPILLADFVRLMEECANRKADLTSAPMMDSDMAYTYADISKARRLLDYHPTVSVAEGVARSWQWHQENEDQHR